MAKLDFTCPGAVRQPLPQTRFRDIAYMWFYATMTSYTAVANGSATDADLMKCLAGKLDPNYSQRNSDLLKAMCDAIVNDANNLQNIPAASSALRAIVNAGDQPWPGQHPGVNELDSIFGPPGA